MREIKFRGKSLKNEEWLYGDLLHIDGDDAIAPINDIEWADGSELTARRWGWIDPETVGQFTGLFDKNGKEIYEGDIVHYSDTMRMSYNAPVIFQDGKFGIREKYLGGIATLGTHETYNDGKCYFDIKKSYEVIGSIYDNPELLK